MTKVVRTSGPKAGSFFLALIVLGVALCLWPLVTDLVARAQARQVISALSDSVAGQDAARQDELLRQAHAHNARLAGQSPAGEDPVDVWPYLQQLAGADPSEPMAWLEVPRSGVYLPIYHGDADSALAQGVGHWEASSLPVGGSHAHAWLEGHSGMQQSNLFDGIRLLEEGDVIGVHVAGLDLAYRVTGWQIVDPTDVTGPQIGEGDLLTLVTCTTTPDAFNPKGRTGVNDKRLLVSAERCEYVAEDFRRAAQAAATDVELVINEHSYQAVVALVAVAALVVASVVRRAARNRKAA